MQNLMHLLEARCLPLTLVLLLSVCLIVLQVVMLWLLFLRLVLYKILLLLGCLDYIRHLEVTKGRICLMVLNANICASECLQLRYLKHNSFIANRGNCSHISCFFLISMKLLLQSSNMRHSSRLILVITLHAIKI